jgi:DNA-binding GntR family transcriptional regulator
MVQEAVLAEDDLSSLKPISPVSVVDQVTTQIRRLILVGSLQAGTSFSIADISGRLGVSPIPVREALRRLETEGLVSLPHAKRAVVSPVDLQDGKDVFHLMHVVERDIAARAAPNYTEDDLAEMQQHLDEIINSTDPETFFKAEDAFHSAVLRPGMTPWDEKIMSILGNAAHRYGHLCVSNGPIFPFSEEWRVKAHQAILDAARTRSPERVVEAVGAHARHTQAALVEALKGIAR